MASRAQAPGVLYLMNRHQTAMIAAWVFLGTTAFAAEPPGGWLNARDFGASGSKFGTTAQTTAGSRQIVVKDAGDFKVGQGVVISKCMHYQDKRHLWGPRKKITWANDLGDKAELRGYDGSQGDWLVLILDVPPGTPSTFRWSEDFGQTWHETVPITGQWQPLRDGMEVRFGKHDWENGYTVVFSLRGQLATTVAKIEGKVITLRDAPARTSKDAVLRHRDDDALQAAIDEAIQQKKNVCIPVGHYRLFHGLSVRDAEGITIEGANGAQTVLDISEGEGACLTLSKGTQVNVRNLRFLGHSGFDQRRQCGSIPMRGACYFWGFAAKSCNAVSVQNTQRVLIENCHATKMSSECFYSASGSRRGNHEPKHYTQAITYLRCSVVDSGRNAFNNNDMAENTSVLYCRIVDVGGCTWEGASRFVKFIGNYVRNSGTVAMGNIGSRAEHLEQLGSAQHIVADNVFESGACYGRAAIRTCHGASQVVIRNNLFVNFGTCAIDVSGLGDARHLPSKFTTVTGNILDMTSLAEKPEARVGIDVSATDTIVSDNQIYVRGQCDSKVTAIRVKESAVNVGIHDNLIRQCGQGIAGNRVGAAVSEVVDATTFLTPGRTVPLERRQSHQYRRWNLAWLSGSKPKTLSLIDSFDPETLQFKLTQPHEMAVGDRFEVFPPSANWNIRDNTISGCAEPAVLDCYGSDTSMFRDNVITRGGAEGVKQAVTVSGRFELIGNQISGFDEKDSAALALNPDGLGRVRPGSYRDNVFQKCSQAVKESQPGIWKASHTGGNLFIDCGATPEE